MTDQPTSPVHGWTADRLALFKRVGGAFLAILALLVFRALTADDGTHGIKAGECVAAVGQPTTSRRSSAATRPRSAR